MRALFPTFPFVLLRMMWSRLRLAVPLGKNGEKVVTTVIVYLAGTDQGV